MHRGCADGICLCQDILGKDGGHHYCNTGSAVGRVAAEHYFEEVFEGVRLIEAQCSKNIMF